MAADLLSNVKQGEFQMPVAKIHVLEGRYDERRLTNVSQAVQSEPHKGDEHE